MSIQSRKQTQQVLVGNQNRNMADVPALWRATGMKDEDFSKPIIADKQAAEVIHE